MFSLGKRTKTGEATFVLLYLKQSSFASAISALRAPDVVELIRRVTETCERVAEETGAGLVRFQGDCLLAWNEDDLRARPDYRGVAEMLLKNVRGSLQGLLGNDAFTPDVSIAITRGICVFERNGDEYAHLFGDAMNRVVRMADAAGRNVISVDDQTLPEFAK